ncbi:uncharacterized protein CMC5_008730 [Chondromyces crocatus]|uniref:Uncharacterized protein n=1 Tax=Chondromyces crocatus TaxID=52 RepID=A0A0K1E7U5_CHOCO|nr:uncharacterized protein CMC5_008730 [Chondromyces crocatus]
MRSTTTCGPPGFEEFSSGCQPDRCRSVGVAAFGSRTEHENLWRCWSGRSGRRGSGFLQEGVEAPAGGCGSSCRRVSRFLQEGLEVPAGGCGSSCRRVSGFLQEGLGVPAGGCGSSCRRVSGFLQEGLGVPAGGSRGSCRRVWKLLQEGVEVPAGGCRGSCRRVSGFLQEGVGVPAGGSRGSCRRVWKLLQEGVEVPAGGSRGFCRKVSGFLQEGVEVPAAEEGLEVTAVRPFRKAASPHLILPRRHPRAPARPSTPNSCSFWRAFALAPAQASTSSPPLPSFLRDQALVVLNASRSTPSSPRTCHRKCRVAVQTEALFEGIHSLRRRDPPCVASTGRCVLARVASCDLCKLAASLHESSVRLVQGPWPPFLWFDGDSIVSRMA